MKNLLLILCLLAVVLQNCTPKIVGSSSGLSEAEFKLKGEKFAKAWEDDVNRQDRKQERGTKNLRTFGIVTTGLGILGGAVSAGLDDDGKAGLAYGISVASAGLGVAQLLISTNKDVPEYVTESLKAIRGYENMAGTESARYKFLTDEYLRIRKDTKLGSFNVKD